MEDLSLHILDIVENSIRAGARNVKIKIIIDKKNDLLNLEIEDDGKGMTQDEVNKIFDPFYTGQNKKTGLGLSLLKDSVEKAEGQINVFSKVNTGTKVVANFKLSNPDMIPIGDISETMLVLAISNQDVRFKLNHICNGNEFVFDTDEFKEARNDSLNFLKEVKNKLENYKKFLATIKGDLYGI